jgi:transposase
VVFFKNHYIISNVTYGETMRYIKGSNRRQQIFFPETVDDYVDDNNPVRFIDAFVDGLNLVKLKFTRAQTKKTGRKPYNPTDLLKLYIYGYLNKTRSSRRLEKLTHTNIEVMWLLRKLKPDFKTIADFRKDNKKTLKRVFRQFVLLCKSMDLFGSELIAIDGSKFSAVNHNDRNYTKDKLKNLLKQINEQIEKYLTQLDQGDEAESEVKEFNSHQLQKKIDQLRQDQAKLEQIQDQLKTSGESQVSFTDTDSRMMKSNKGSDVSYNVQIVTDSKHKLIVEFEVTNDINDINQLSNMAIKAKDTLGVDQITATADTGYHNETEVAKCEQENITCYIPKPQPKSAKQNNKFFTKADFYYDAQNDCYICPAQQILTYRGRKKWATKKEQKKYGCSNCNVCSIRSQCMGEKRGNRYLYRGAHENLVDQMEQRVLENPEITRKRKELVEHPFGTMKHWMDQGYFLTRGFEKVTGEMSLTALCYNIKRVLNIVDFKELMANLQAFKANFVNYFYLFFKSKYFLAINSKCLQFKIS